MPHSTVTCHAYIMPYSTVTCQTYIVPYSTLSCCTYIVSYATVTCCTYIVLHTTVTRLIDFCGINNFVILFFDTKKYTNLLGSHLTQETRNKLTTFSSLASFHDPYKIYVLEEEWMLAVITTLLSHTSN